MILTQHSELTQVRKQFQDKTIVFCSGAFDLPHPAHVIFFEDCKKFGDILVVTVGDDISIRSYKGHGRPIFNHAMRTKMIDAMKPVDYCFMSIVPDLKNLFSDIEIIFAALKPNVYVIKDDAFDIPSRQKMCQQFDVNLIILKREESHEFSNISTTNIIETIIRTHKI